MIRWFASIEERRYAWIVVCVSCSLLVVANGTLFLLIVAMKDIAATFDWPRTIPSTAYAFQFLGGGIGGILMGWWLDRSGMGKPALLGAIMIGLGMAIVSQVVNAWQFLAVYGLIIGFLGNATMFSPLLANTTRWFVRYRGLAVGIVASGQSIAGAIWPPIFEYGLFAYGWRDTYLYFGMFAIATMVPLSFVLRRSPAKLHDPLSGPRRHVAEGAPILKIPPRVLLGLLCVAIVGCCIPMSLPLAHLKSYATDIGITPMSAASLLSLALVTSFVSRALFAGLLIEWMGGLRTLFLFSLIQATALSALPFMEGYWVLAVVAAVFGFGFGGIAPAYPVIVREFLPADWAGRCTGIVVLFGTIGMATGGWIGGIGYDMTGGYFAPFVIGVSFNFVNLAIIGWLISASRSPRKLAFSGAT